nr:restriction endonuclease subunit S [Amycolatopsis sp. FDAARGOS 1241]
MPLRRVFRVVNGGTPTADEGNWGGGIAWATPVDLNAADGVIERTQRTLTPLGVRTGSSIVRRDSILISTRAPIGYVARTAEPMAFNQGCRALVPWRSVDVRFFVYQLSAITQELQSRGLGSTFQELSGGALAEIPVHVPPAEEQRRIADFLDAETSRIDDMSALQRTTLNLLAERRRAVLAHLVTGADEVNRGPSRLAWTDSLPVRWDSVGLSLVAKMGSGHTPSRSRADWWFDCDIPWITTGEVAQIRDDRRETIYETREKISKLGLANSAAELHPAGTVVLSRTASAGFSAVMGYDMATSQDYATWTCGPRLDPYYLLWCLRAMRADLLGRLAMGSTHKTIYFPDLQGLRIPLPPMPEQLAIVEAIRDSNAKIDELHDRINRQLGLLAERRQALITAAVTGQLDVTTARSGVGA